MLNFLMEYKINIRLPIGIFILILVGIQFEFINMFMLQDCNSCLGVGVEINHNVGYGNINTTISNIDLDKEFNNLNFEDLLSPEYIKEFTE